MKTIRTVIAGIGLRGLYLADPLLKNDLFQVVGLVDAMPRRMDLLCDGFNLKGIEKYTTIDQCLAECDFDALIVLTPDHTHADLVIPALSAGRFVYVEKPLDITADRMTRIIDADRAAGQKTFVGFNVRFAPLFATMRRLIDQDVVGRVLTIHGDEFYDGGRTYFRRWNRLRKFGGLWLNKASHDFDIMQWFAGGRPTSVFASSAITYYKPKPEAAMYCRDCDLLERCPDRFDKHMERTSLHTQLYALNEEVSGQKADLCLFNSDKDTFDHAAALVTFDNEVVATYSCNLVAGFTNRMLRVTGVKATIEGDMAANRIIIRRRDPSSEEIVTPAKVEGGHGGGDVMVLRCFADFVRGQKTHYVPPEEAAIAVKMGLAATRSCDEGAAVKM